MILTFLHIYYYEASKTYNINSSRLLDLSVSVYGFPLQIPFIITGSIVLARTSAALHRKFRNLIQTLGRTPLDEWPASREGLYLHRTTQRRNTKTNIPALSGVRTHDPSNQAAKIYISDHRPLGSSLQIPTALNVLDLILKLRTVAVYDF
jgi:hypothetical protein